MLTVFADPAAGFATGGRQGLEEAFEFLAHPRAARRDLPLGESLQKPAAGFAGTAGGVIDATEKVVRDRDEYLGHVQRISGISDA